jgi:hypothetical protein
MVFEPYTREGMLTRLDAEFYIACAPGKDVAPARFRGPARFAWILALGAWMLLLPASSASAQANPTVPSASGSQSTTAKTSTAQPSAHHAVHHHRHAKPQAGVVAPPPVVPPPPPRPAEQPPNPATIEFNQGLLSVRAQNSSLVNILVQIQHQTGLVIDGLSHDQRVYGQYGPANISTTLSALLDGSGYDFVIVGGGGSHAAPRLILSTPSSAGAPAVAPPPVVNNPDVPPSDNGDQADPADPTDPPQPKSPQEIFNELRRMHPQ